MKQSQQPASRVKVNFHLEPDEFGYPPARSEFVWCRPTKRHTYTVDNIPFFVRDLSLGDEISAKKEGKVFEFVRLARPSKNSTVHVLVKNSEKTESIVNKLNSLGCGSEFMAKLSLLAVNIPPNARIADALAFLDEEAENGNIGIEESAVRYQ